MAKSNLRLCLLNSLKDTLNKKSNWLDMGVSHVEPRFVNSANITGAMYQQGSYAFNYNEDIYLNFTSMFTVRFWAKSSAGAIPDALYKNKIAIVIAGTAVSVDIPDTVDLTSWNYFTITRDIENKLDISINGNIVYTDTHAGDFNLNSDGYVYIGNQNRYATGFNFTVDDFVVYDGSVDATDVASDYLDLDTIKQILIIDASGQVWGYSWDGSSSSSGGGADVTPVPSATLALASESDEVVIPEGITAISYTLTEDGQEITREIAVEPTDTVKYYKEEDGYYTLAVYDNTGAIKSKGYTMHSDNAPNISINYSEDVNNNFTASDEYVDFIPLSVETITQNPYTWVAPDGVTKMKYKVYFNYVTQKILFTSPSAIDVTPGASYVFYFNKSAKTLVTPDLKFTGILSSYSFNSYEFQTGTSINNS